MASIYLIHLSIILQCFVLHSRRKKSYPELRCVKNGSINLELVKSLFISENEKDFGEGGKGERGEGQGGGKRGRKRKERLGEYTPAKQQQEFQKVKRKIHRQ